MGVKPSPDCLAIDGGGTRCRFALRHNGNVTLVEGGEANVSSDFERAVVTILSGLDELSKSSGHDLSAIARMPAFIGLAGVTGPALIDQLKDALPFSAAQFSDDRPAAVRGALGPEDGVLAHCGTGSFFAAQIGGKTRFAGGWGPVLGDEGSAQLIGRRLLWLVLQHVDGFQPQTPLIQKVLAKFGGAPEIVAFASGAKPHEMGALAPLITNAARVRDSAAQVLLQEAADTVAHSIKQIGWTTGMAICLTGGIAPFYEDYLPEDMRNDVRERQADPIEGALALAQELALARGA